ncbi:ATP-grasp domain-containing protein [Hugenholtzia roseola]|uniref:ATP-grasp domain-containing protein n=1 Tax=Hugenholtzia roseola TaxID=1002 RepID=UPI00047C23F3|nr:hypothetical protein [Hugenholtzia roseola]
MEKPLWWIRLTHFEYWSYWFLYLPLLPYGLYWAWKARSLSYFTALNPALPLSGLVGEKKDEILAQVPQRYLPKTILVRDRASLESIISDLKQKGIDFPCIIKPNIGERGAGVEKLETEEELRHYLSQNQAHNEKKSPFLVQEFLIQEFLSEPIELGVLYFKMPHNPAQSDISSITEKRFLSVVGNGKSSLKDLVESTPRGRFQGERLAKKWAAQWHQIVPFGEKILIEPIGNHCRGTQFLDATARKTPEMIAAFDSLTKDMNGFYYGRFDIKIHSWEAFQRGEGIKIMEINGVSSEPAHIYDPDYSLLSAYSTLAKHIKLIYQISVQNKALGIAYTPFSVLKKTVLRHLFSE